MATIRVDVDVVLETFSDDELISELEYRGYVVPDADEVVDYSETMTPEEVETLLSLIDKQQPKVGSQLYFIREKLLLHGG